MTDNKEYLKKQGLAGQGLHALAMQVFADMQGS